MTMQGFTELEDDVLESAAGGYLKVSQWVSFANETIVPMLYRALNGADEADSSVVNMEIGVIRSTFVSGASVAGPINNAYVTYNGSYRSLIHSASVRSTLDNALSMCVNYLAANS